MKAKLNTPINNNINTNSTENNEPSSKFGKDFLKLLFITAISGAAAYLINIAINWLMN
ncbi:MAG: hypothetical protein KDC88_12740 [Ignavibacteriae bacterium]|nr:hypothetical protein [Ignavibacteriota bacterium]MCB9208846.1 hypothetical protein [Ignavibacteriales bacterium]MCB9218236.1 hypothetical protein [Ignavibacteriales bacterium]